MCGFGVFRRYCFVAFQPASCHHPLQPAHQYVVHGAGITGAVFFLVPVFCLTFPFENPTKTRQTAMAKDKSPTKEKKKEPAKSLKEKRAAKQEKKGNKRD